MDNDSTPLSPSIFVLERHPVTPRKINMELKPEPIEKEKIIFQTSILGFHVNFPGCMCFLVENPCHFSVKIKLSASR